MIMTTTITIFALKGLDNTRALMGTLNRTLLGKFTRCRVLLLQIPAAPCHIFS